MTPPFFFKRLALSIWLWSALGIISFADELPLDEMNIAQIEKRRAAIETELGQLAVYTLRTGSFGVSGYRSLPKDKPEIDGEWIQINFQSEFPIDEIVLVPTLWRYSDEMGYLSDGFPEAFYILAGVGGDDEGEVVAKFDATDKLLPRVAPVVVPLSGVRASWIRIVPTRLTKRDRDKKYIFQLSEVFVFSDEKNIALHQLVTRKPVTAGSSGIWRPRAIVDGGVPYLMDSSLGYEGSAHTQLLEDKNHFTLDLEKEYLISAIHLHAAYQSKSAPPEFNVNWGIPDILAIEGGNTPDFRDAEILLQHEFKDIGGFSPILMWNFPTKKCRYVRITGDSSSKNQVSSSNFNSSRRIGFTEIEILAEGKVVSKGKGPVRGAGQASGHAGLSKLTDGYNYYGKTLGLRKWMNELARRHELEAELLQLNTRAGILYERQQATLKILKWLIIALVILVIVSILVGRYRRMRQAAIIRERFTADLHDHVGASLHAIGILSSHTKEIQDSPEKLAKALDQIELMTGRASEATRDFCKQQMEKEAHGNLAMDLKRTAGRMIANLSYTFHIEGEEFLQHLKPAVRSDFFLFFKECLININRHADATEVEIRLVAAPALIELTISDNGRGIDDGDQFDVPPSLMRRAKFLGAKVAIDSPVSGGSRISIKLKPNRRVLRNP